MNAWPSVGIAARRSRSRSAGPVIGPLAASARRTSAIARCACAGLIPFCASRVRLVAASGGVVDGVQPEVVLAGDQVKRAPVQPRDHQRALVGQCPVDVGAANAGRPGADREPGSAPILALDGEQPRDGRDGVTRAAPGEQLRGQPSRESRHAAARAAASWPQAASMSRPRVTRTVALSPWRSSSARNASIAFGLEPWN